MTWQTLTKQHAIERVRIVLTLVRTVPPKKIRSLGTQIEEHQQTLGFGGIAVQSGQAIALEFGPNGPVAVQQPQEVNGWEFQRLSATGAPIEAFQFTENMLTYEAFEYSRWPILAERFHTMASKVVSELLSLDDAATLALEYHNRFVFDGPPKKAEPSQLLQIANDIVPAPAQSGTELWHAHRGWFEQGAYGRLLLQHNLDARDEVIEDRQRRVIRILTRSEARKGYWTIADDDLKPHLDVMHDRTKQVFAEALTDDIRRQVGITSEDQ